MKHTDKHATRRASGGGERLLLALLCAAAPLAAGTARGETAPAAAETSGIEEIVVTARKREESTQNIPVSVSVLTTRDIARYDLANLETVASTTPQFTIGRAPSGSGATLVLRGIGSNTTSIGLEQSVAVVADGVYYGQGRVINEGFFDLGRLEILKGPQALFFGKNATAGVVSITTADPTSKPEFIGRIGEEIESRQLIGEAIASGPLTDTLSARLAVRASKMSGSYFRNIGVPVTYPTTDAVAPNTVTVHQSPVAAVDAGALTEAYARLTLKWTPSDRLTATLKANIGKDDSNNPAASSVLYNCPTGASALNPLIKCGRQFYSSANLVPADIAATLPHANDSNLGNLYRSWAVTANFDYKLTNDVTLTSVSNYNYNRNVFIFDADSVSAPGAVGVYATEWSPWHALSTELRATTSYAGPLNGMVGIYLQKTKREYLAWTASGGQENSAAPNGFQRYLANSKDSQTDGKTFAAFAQLIWKLTPDLEAAVGARFTNEKKDSYFIEPYSSPARVAAGIFLPGVRIAADQKFTNTSPEATLTWRPTSDVTVYGAFKTGYKSGGFSNSGILSRTSGLADFAFNPEKAVGGEVGVKTTLFDRQLRFNVGAYDYKIKNLQVDFFNSPVFAFSTINAGNATSKGVELELEFAPHAVDGLNLHGTLNYNEAKYGDFTNAPCYTGERPVDGCTIPSAGARPVQDLSGKPTANAPPWTASLGVSYERQVSSRLTAGFSTDVRYSDNYIPTAFGNPNTLQYRYANLDASLRLKTVDDHWELAVIGKNLTNRWYATGGTDAPSTGRGTGTAGGVRADQIGFVNLPRSIEFQLTGRY